jgi:hypothetical protein
VHCIHVESVVWVSLWLWGFFGRGCCTALATFTVTIVPRWGLPLVIIAVMTVVIILPMLIFFPFMLKSIGVFLIGGDSFVLVHKPGFVRGHELDWTGTISRVGNGTPQAMGS